MNRLAFAATSFALLALGACDRGNQDQVNAAETNTAADLDQLSNEAANVASEAEALENQSAQLNQEAQSISNAPAPSTPADENIVGM